MSVAKILQSSLSQALGSLEEAGWQKEPWRLAITWMVSQLPRAIPPYAPKSVGGTDMQHYSAGLAGRSSYQEGVWQTWGGRRGPCRLLMSRSEGGSARADGILHTQHRSGRSGFSRIKWSTVGFTALIADVIRLEAVTLGEFIHSI